MTTNKVLLAKNDEFWHKPIVTCYENLEVLQLSYFYRQIIKPVICNT